MLVMTSVLSKLMLCFVSAVCSLVLQPGNADVFEILVDMWRSVWSRYFFLHYRGILQTPNFSRELCVPGGPLARYHFVKCFLDCMNVFFLDSGRCGQWCVVGMLCGLASCFYWWKWPWLLCWCPGESSHWFGTRTWHFLVRRPGWTRHRSFLLSLLM